jgi:hypothetical protein
MQGVVVQFRVMDGQVSRGDIVKFMNTKCEYDIVELGVLAPKAVEVRGWLWGGLGVGGGLTPKHACLIPWGGLGVVGGGVDTKACLSDHLEHLTLTPLGQACGWASLPAPLPPLHRAVQLVPQT